MGNAVLLAAVIGVTLGALAAYHAGRFIDVVVPTLALLCFATPLFWVGMMLVVVFSVWLDWLPVDGMATVSSGLTGIRYAADVLHHLILPSITLALFYVAIYTRPIRASVIEVRRQAYVRTAVARGVQPARLFRVHVMCNALIPFVTMLGMQIGSIIGGAVVVETVFSWPGLGRLALASLVQRDMNVLLGMLLCSSILVVLVNWARISSIAGLTRASPRTDMLSSIDQLAPRAAIGSRARRSLTMRLVRSPSYVIGGGLLLVILFMAAAAGWLCPGDPLELVADPVIRPGQDPAYLLGTDMLGRNILAGIVHGSRASLLIASVATAIAAALGIAALVCRLLIARKHRFRRGIFASTRSTLWAWSFGRGCLRAAMAVGFRAVRAAVRRVNRSVEFVVQPIKM